MPSLGPHATLITSRLAGPLAIAALLLVELAVGLRVLIWYLQKIFSLVLAIPLYILMVTDWLPLGMRQVSVVVLPLVVVTLISLGIIGAGGDGTHVWPEEKAVTAGGDGVASAFSAWLQKRKIGSSRYPVFVVAAQGGGIYAASTIGAFLATMQDHCPAFARHVFAISAVSGGSVGATLFNAAFADSIARGANSERDVDVEPGCDSLFWKSGELARRLRAITQDDHISPVLAYLVPDFLKALVAASVLQENAEPERSSPCGSESSAWGSRARVLEMSFIDSFRRSGPWDHAVNDDCSKQKERNLLTRPFSDAWSPNGDVPVLLLNATWVETGYRIAFAPFALQSLEGERLFSFGSSDFKSVDPTLIEAAVISARFPALMPPWSLSLSNGSRLTVVDGGYADSSGIATAHQLYSKLKSVGGDDIDLYLITLTDKYKMLPAASGIEQVGPMPVRGWLYDLLSPVSTLLSVRDLQSRRALDEARRELGDKMIVVQLDKKGLPLPLGWKLSGLSSDVIRFTIGDPERCNAIYDRGNTAVSISNRNSCELKRIVDLISPKAISAPARGK